jgi:DNA helicase-2/ATP-dependent DNA helicase PcrA
VLDIVARTGLFTVPDVLVPFVSGNGSESLSQGANEDEDEKDELSAWRRALGAPTEELDRYNQYVGGKSKFDTHQGVKGREFPRVMVIINDDEARGFLFSYEKLFGAKERSKTDVENEASGNEHRSD